MKKLISVISVLFISFLIPAQSGGTPPSLNYKDIYFPQQVTNGAGIPFAIPCFQTVRIGEATLATLPQVPYTHCGIPYRYIHAGNNIEIWTTAGSISSCPHVATFNGYPSIILVDIVLQGCTPVFPPTIAFPGAFPGADQYQLIVPEAAIPTHTFWITIFGYTLWYYWISIPTPPTTALIGSWVSTQAVRLDTTLGYTFFSNRADALIGPPYTPN